MRFYTRVPKKNKHLVEVAFFSNYPDVEIVDTKIMMRNLPRNNGGALCARNGFMGNRDEARYRGCISD